MNYYFEYYTLVPDDIWKWKFFTPEEIASKGDGSILIVPDALDKLELARKEIGAPLYINSAYRDPIHNARIGGAPLSRHKQGDAFDISLKNIVNKQELLKVCKSVGFTGFGLYKTFLHVDCGKKRQWGKW